MAIVAKSTCTKFDLVFDNWKENQLEAHAHTRL